MALLRTLLTSAKESFFTLFKHPRFLALSAVSDFLFLLLYGFVTAPLVKKIIENLVGFVQCMAKANSTKSPWTFLFWIVLYLASVYLIFVVFQGVAWWSATRMAVKQRTPIVPYLFRFSKATAPWYLLFVAVHAVSYFTTLAALAAQQTSDLSHTLFFRTLFFIILAAAFLSYALLPNMKGGAVKKSLFIGVRLHKTLPLFAVVGVVFYLLNLVLAVLSALLPRQILAVNIFYFIIAALVVFPFLCWARGYLMLGIKKLFKR